MCSSDRRPTKQSRALRRRGVGEHHLSIVTYRTAAVKSKIGPKLRVAHGRSGRTESRDADSVRVDRTGDAAVMRPSGGRS